MFDLVKTSVNTCFQHSVAHASKRFVINNGKVYTQHARNVAHWVRSFSFPGSPPSCDVFFFPGRTCADNFPRSPWKKTPPHTGVDPGQLNERTHSFSKFGKCRDTSKKQNVTHSVKMSHMSPNAILSYGQFNVENV